MKVFIVENSTFVRDVLIRALGGLAGIAVCGHAAQSAAALEQILRLQPDAVILDLRGGGVDVLRAIEKQQSPPAVLVFSGDIALREASLANVSYFFDKSTGFLEMVAALKRLATGAGVGSVEE